MRAATPLLVSAALLGAARVGAEPPPKIATRLAYTITPGIAGCPSEAALTDMIGSYFGYQPIEPEAGAILTVTIRAKGKQPVADLSLRDAEGTARWEESTEEGTDCDDLVENVALLIRLRLGPLAWGSKPPPAWLAAEPPPARPPPAPPPSLLASPPSAPAEDKPIRPSDPLAAAPPKEDDAPPWLPRPELSVTFVVAPWATPRLALGGGAGIGARWPFALVGFEFRGLAGLFAAENAYASTQPYLWMGVGSACFTPRPFMLCALGAFGRYSGTIEPTAGDVSRLERQSTLRSWIGLRVGADWKLHDRFSLRFLIDGMLATNVETWSVGHPTQGKTFLWQTPDFFASLGVAGVVRF